MRASSLGTAIITIMKIGHRWRNLIFIILNCVYLKLDDKSFFDAVCQTRAHVYRVCVCVCWRIIELFETDCIIRWCCGQFIPHTFAHCTYRNSSLSFLSIICCPINNNNVYIGRWVNDETVTTFMSCVKSTNQCKIFQSDARNASFVSLYRLTTWPCDEIHHVKYVIQN